MTVTADPPVSPVNDLPADDPWRRIFVMMLDPDATYSNVQMAWLVEDAFRRGQAAAFDEGYRARVAEEEAAYPPAPIFDGLAVGQAIDRQAYRARVAAEARQHWPGDWPGLHNGAGLDPAWSPTWCGVLDDNDRPAPHRRHHVRPTRTDPSYICQGRRPHADS